MICEAVTASPLIASTRSPGRSPACAAGARRSPRARSCPGTIRCTVVVALPPATMNTIANSRIAKARLVAGPARMAATRFHVR